jgi:hypothetical protein
VSKFDHNRPELRLKDNLARLRRSLDAEYAHSVSSNQDGNDSIDWLPEDPDDRKDWEICTNVIRAHREETNALINVLSMGRGEGESDEQRRQSRESIVRLHELAEENTDRAIVAYLVAGVEARHSERGSAIYDQFYKATDHSARKGITAAVELQERIQRVIDNLPGTHNEKNPNK